MAEKPTIHVAIPAMNEYESLPRTLGCIQLQDYQNYEVWVCVNQPEGYWTDPQRQEICQNNSKTLSFLQKGGLNNLHVIDHSSKGKGWTGKNYGVGIARKVLMDTISKNANSIDIILSLDADTWFESGYFQSVVKVFENFPKAVALSNPYYHELTGDETLDRAMLRYEIYMRHYAINLWRIESPYSFTALGSAIAVPVNSFRRIGGMTPKKSGEDFYFLQKLRKLGQVANHNTHKVFPATRYSDRVFFGTGPALIKGSQGSWESYPIYNYQLFDEVAETYKLFAQLYDQKIETRFIKYLNQQFGEDDIFEPLRKNFSSREQFVKACHHKVDALRILQFLKQEQSKVEYGNEQNLKYFLQKFHPKVFSNFEETIINLDFAKTPVRELNQIRDSLAVIEIDYQQKGMESIL
jgi:glycosyltransferase involved in cell wall biosynthesis